MEFRFNVEPIFIKPIVKINSNLLPIGFKGDRKVAIDVATKVAEVVNVLGEASAKAQGLTKPVTTAQKLRMTDHNIYLLGDKDAGKSGAVLGLLKVGKKSLYVFDQNGDTQMITAPCVLDFYVHESRQRSGLGKDLFETMLKDEQYQPEKLAIDRPSDKLLGFLRKHYGLERTIPQMNNFVVYEGFFANDNSDPNRRMHNITSSPNTALFGPQFVNDEYKKRANNQEKSSTSVPLIQNSPVGRYAAPRPMGSMAEIIHSSAIPSTEEPNSDSNCEPHMLTSSDSSQTDNMPDNNETCNIENLQISVDNSVQIVNESEHLVKGHSYNYHTCPHKKDVHFAIEVNNEKHQKKCKPNHFPLSKQHTGLKNISYNVGIAVSPTNTMEFNQEQTETVGVSNLNQSLDKPAAGLWTPHDDNTGTCSTVLPGESAGYTDQGYYDLKFHHNKLW